MMYPVISARQLKEYQQQKCDFVLIDIRSAREFEANHISGAVNIPQERLSRVKDMLPRSKRLILYCSHGSHSLLACNELRKMGFDAFSLAGGISCYRMLPEDTDIC